MAKNILLKEVSEKTNEAICVKKAELLLNGKDYTKPKIVEEIIKEWLEFKAIANGTIKA